MEEKFNKALDILCVKQLRLECDIQREFNSTKKKVLRARHKELKTTILFLKQVRDDTVSIDEL